MRDINTHPQNNVGTPLPSFISSEAKVDRALVWVRISRLDHIFYDRNIILTLVATVRHLLVDTNTLNIRCTDNKRILYDIINVPNSEYNTQMTSYSSKIIQLGDKPNNFILIDNLKKKKFLSNILHKKKKQVVLLKITFR